MKKPCSACGKQIPSVALDCVFCGAKQPEASGTDIVTSASSSMTDPTLVGLRASDLEGAPKPNPLMGMPTGEMNAAVAVALTEGAHANATANGDSGSEAGAAFPSQAKLTGVLPAIQAPEPEPEPPPAPEQPAGRPADVSTAEVPLHRAEAEVAAAAETERPFEGLARGIMGVGGAVLIALFFLPWHGVSSWQLLESLGGADFVRQLFYLTGGIVLLSSAVLPVPFAFRAAIGASVAATPVLLGAGGMIDGWRGVVAAMAILGLPATHLLRAKAKTSGAARFLVGLAVAAVAILYVAPVSGVVPIVGVFKMIFSGDIGPVVMGIFILIPLVFAALSLLGLLGRDLTDVGVLLSVLSLLWAPMVVALRGLLLEDGTQVYVAVALLWASATAALSLAQLLSLAAHEPRTA
jgi:hypothetical protein